MQLTGGTFGAIAGLNPVECSGNIVSIEINRRYRIGTLRAATGPTPKPTVDARSLGRRPGTHMKLLQPAQSFVTDLHWVTVHLHCPNVRQFAGSRADRMRSQWRRLISGSGGAVVNPLVRSSASGARRRRPTIALATAGCAPYILPVALLFESGPYFVSLQASNPVPYPIAAVRPVTRCCVTEGR